MKNVGTISIGVRMPILKQGDNLVEEVVNSIIKASTELNMPIDSGDVIAITESIVARTDGDYISVDDIAKDIMDKYNNGKKLENIYIYQPVLSRNRFAIILRAIARASKRILIGFTAPTDEVGNEIISRKDYLTGNYSKLDVENFKHPFTGINYIQYYRNIVETEGCSFAYEILQNNINLDNFGINNVLVCNVHDRDIITEMFLKHSKCYNLQDICSSKCCWGLLGCNKVDEETVKLFPSKGQIFVEKLQKEITNTIGRNVECMIYGDGGFKCPICGVWEELDPVISPAFTSGLVGTPNEIKLKYFADDKFKSLNGDKLNNAIKEEIKNKKNNLEGSMTSQGTTPRQLTDLLGSLSDLTSGSGDKGTPCIWIKNYFKNFSDE